MSLLDDMERKKKALTRLKHPLCKEELRLREVYATGVALLMAGTDEHMNNAEKEHLEELVDALLLSDDPAERIIATVADAGADILDSVVEVIEIQEHKYLFILDLYRAANVDGKILPEDQKMIDIFMEMLDLKPVAQDWLKQFSEGMTSKDQEKMQDALIEAYHFCLELPMEGFRYFYNELMPIPESTEIDLPKIDMAARQGVSGAVEWKKEFNRHNYIDQVSGLMWARNGNIAGKEMTWHDAVSWVKHLKYGGYSNWRLPTEEELKSFLKPHGEKCPSKWFNENGFHDVQADIYWSSSNYSRSAYSTWYEYMHGGSLNYSYSDYAGFIWPVRGVQIKGLRCW